MVKITGVQVSPSGKDTPDKLNEEYVEVRNTGTQRVQMIGWSLSDERGHRYVFPVFLANGERWVLDPGEYALIHTGTGNDRYLSPSPGHAGTFHFYWGRGWYVWNNDGDTATLCDHVGNVIDRKPVRGVA